MPTSFSRFAVGDVTIFERSFSLEDFAAFSRLSGDANPLHHDQGHAQGTRFGQIILPLHLTLAPLSRVAGMVFPGEPSLYLGHEVRAAQPVHYGELLRYSARIEAVNLANRVLTLRVLALRGTEVVLDALMRVQATTEAWDSEPELPILRTASPGRAVVTGASGAIGGAVALALASRGWALLLQDRGDGPHRQALQASFDRLGADVAFVSADLATAPGRASLAAAVGGYADVEAIIHSASPRVTSPLEQLVSVNYAAFKDIAAAALPGMLARQKGRLLLIGSTAMMRALAGWEDYAAAKTMAGGLAVGLDGRFAEYGVRGLVLLPGYVATPFSDELRGDAPALLPQEVATAVAEMIDKPEAPAVVLELGRRSQGGFGFLSLPTTVETKVDPAPAVASASAPSSPVAVADVVRRVLRLSSKADLGSAGIAVTPGWDSLRQIEIVLALEAALNIQFTSAELTGLGTFNALAAACQAKMGDVTPTTLG